MKFGPRFPLRNEFGGDAGGDAGGGSTGSGFPAETMSYDPSEGIDLSGSFGTPEPKKNAAPAPAAASPAAATSQTPAATTTPAATAPATPDAQPGLPDASTAAATGTPPKSWKAEMHQHFATLPPDVQAYIHTREQQALEGVMGYKTAVDQFNNVFKPWESVMKQAGLTPVQVTQNLASNHQALTTGTKEQRAQHAIKLMHSYGIAPQDIIDNIPAGGTQQAAAPAAQELDLNGHPVVQKLTAELQQQRQLHEARIAREAKAEVDAFAANPQNKYFKELENDIGELLGSGAAETLSEAYEIAKWKNPTVRPKALQELENDRAAKAKADAAAAKNKSRLSLESSSLPAAPPKGSMEAGMREIINKHYGSK